MTPGNGNSDEAECTDCGAHATDDRPLFMVCANYGRGAFLTVLCRQCDHRRWYRGQLLGRRRNLAARDDEAPDVGAMS